MKRTMIQNNRGVGWYVIAGISMLLVAVTLLLVLSFSEVFAGLQNVKDKVKLELNNTAAAASELIYADLAEKNSTSYLDSFSANEANLKADFLLRLKNSLKLRAETYSIDPASINLRFDKKQDSITYLFTCHITIQAFLLDEYRPVSEKEIAISAKHYYKEMDSSESLTGYTYTPSEKEEHSLGGTP